MKTTRYERDVAQSQRYLGRWEETWEKHRKIGWMPIESALDEIAAAYVEGLRAGRRSTAQRSGGEK